MSKRIMVSGVVGLLLSLHVWLAVGQSDRVGLTSDEPVHIVSGLYYNLESDYRFQPENGLLPQRLEALPWLWAGLDVPQRDGPAWARADIWALGESLMLNAGDRGPTLLKASRLVTAGISTLLLLLIYSACRPLCGELGALAALTLAAFSPNLLAHAGLATSDTLGTLGLLVATLAWWRMCHRITAGRVLLAGLAAGLLALSKFTCVMLAPIGILLVLVRLMRRTSLPWQMGRYRGRVRGWRRLGWLAGAGVGTAVIAGLVIWSGYGFRYRASVHASGQFIKPWETILMRDPQPIGLPQLGEPADAQVREIRAGVLQHALGFAREHRLLPEAWLYGLGFVAYHSHYRLSYFDGEYRTTGWWQYFPVAWALKTPLGGIAAWLLGLWAWSRMRTRGALAYRLAPWLATGGVVMVMAVAGSINIGLRHILSVIAIVWLLAGVAASRGRWAAPRWTTWALLVCVMSQLWSAIAVAPHYLAYFNPLAGLRPDRWLVDSNLDWGQGLPELRRWQLRENVTRVFLAYFGSDNPARHGLEVVRFGDHHFDRNPRQLPAPLAAGWYAFGSTMFRRAYSETRGPWTPERESLYQDMLATLHRNDLPADNAARERMLLDFDSLRLARLTHFLEGRPADVVLAGGAMLLFQLDEAEVATAFYAPLRSLNEVIIRRLESAGKTATPIPPATTAQPQG